MLVVALGEVEWEGLSHQDSSAEAIATLVKRILRCPPLMVKNLVFFVASCDFFWFQILSLQSM